MTVLLDEYLIPGYYNIDAADAASVSLVQAWLADTTGNSQRTLSLWMWAYITQLWCALVGGIRPLDNSGAQANLIGAGYVEYTPGSNQGLITIDQYGPESDLRFGPPGIFQFGYYAWGFDQGDGVFAKSDLRWINFEDQVVTRTSGEGVPTRLYYWLKPGVQATITLYAMSGWVNTPVDTGAGPIPFNPARNQIIS